jgi:HTH-type transcriptional regulator/antitoxin HigA
MNFWIVTSSIETSGTTWKYWEPLIEAYEEEHETITDVSDVAMLSQLIEARGVTQRSVAAGTGLPESTISDLLAGRRKFNRGHIAKLSAYFKVSPAVFFGLREAVEA